MVDKYDIKVAIRENLKKGLVFGIQARPAIGHILSFYGYSHEANIIMQVLSHSTRAYIINADGLPGFLVKADLMYFLHVADKQGKLEQAKKWQVLDFDQINEEMGDLQREE